MMSMDDGRFWLAIWLIVASVLLALMITPTVYYNAIFQKQSAAFTQCVQDGGAPVACGQGIRDMRDKDD